MLCYAVTEWDGLPTLKLKSIHMPHVPRFKRQLPGHAWGEKRSRLAPLPRVWAIAKCRTHREDVCPARHCRPPSCGAVRCNDRPRRMWWRTEGVVRMIEVRFPAMEWAVAGHLVATSAALHVTSARNPRPPTSGLRQRRPASGPMRAPPAPPSTAGSPPPEPPAGPQNWRAGPVTRS